MANYIVFLTSGSRGWAKYCTDDGSEWFITIKNVKDCRINTDSIQPINAPDNMEAKRTKVISFGKHFSKRPIRILSQRLSSIIQG